MNFFKEIQQKLSLGDDNIVVYCVSQIELASTNAPSS
jgi:hypothetical protein